jgi:hypothetical protein
LVNIMTVSNINKTPSTGFLHKFLLGDLWWARFRVIFLMISAGLTAITIASWFEVVTPTRIWHDVMFPLLLINLCVYFGVLILQDIFETDHITSQRLTYFVALFLIAGFFVYMEFKYFVIILNGQPIFRYLFVLLVALAGAFSAGVRYVQDIYNLGNYGIAALYLLASFGGIGYPKLVISEGQKKVSRGKVNRLELIGGPGYITIRPGNAILTERLHNPAGVYSAGTFFALRFEMIVTTLNLDDQHGIVSLVPSVTKDGIAVTVRDIQFRYRVWSGQRVTNTTAGRNPTNPYPYTIQAVRNMTYNRSVTVDGLTPWHDAVKGVIVGSITEYIAKHKLDQITAPRYVEGDDPRREIGNQLQTPTVRDKLKDVGAQLLWYDIGHFDVDNKAVSEQRVNTWKAGWIGNAKVTRAYGDAQRIAYQEIGRAEAQAEVLMSIAHAFDDIDLAKEQKDRNIRNIVLMRTAQVLETLSSTSDNERTSNKEGKEGK